VSSNFRAASVRVSVSPIPRKSAKTMTASMSPFAAALTGLSGIMARSSSIPTFGADTWLVSVVDPCFARSRSACREVSEIPSPGRSTLTRSTPRATAIAETATV
jgi:hypothetical protein